MQEQTGYLLLSTGDVLEGVWLGDEIEAEGEMVFNTAMTGYQEVMTDPSYAGQIVTMTYPLIGNYGFNDIDRESLAPTVAGFIISSPCPTPEHYQSNQTILDVAKEHNIPILFQVDTRKLTKIIRKHGEVYGKITSAKDAYPVGGKVADDIVAQVSVKQSEFYPNPERESDLPHVGIIDYGYKHSIKQMLLQFGCDVTVFPFDTTAEELESADIDGVVLSNGPGDPKSLLYLADEIKEIANTFPTLGICLGHQLLALAFGGNTERLPYGHRGSNHPVKDTETGKITITSQNHGYVVDMNSVKEAEWCISHYNVNDKSVEGLKHVSKPVMSVQFHPEAHPGPGDTHDVFKNFVQRMICKGEKKYA